MQLPAAGNIIAFPEVGGLHHRYERRARELAMRHAPLVPTQLPSIHF
jgi:dienelactone hydrolase